MERATHNPLGLQFHQLSPEKTGEAPVELGKDTTLDLYCADYV